MEKAFLAEGGFFQQDLAVYHIAKKMKINLKKITLRIFPGFEIHQK